MTLAGEPTEEEVTMPGRVAYRLRRGSAGRRGLAVAALVLLGGAAAAGCASAHAATLTGSDIPVTTVPGSTTTTGVSTTSCPAGAPTVTVDGQATVNATPNEVSLSLAVQTQATSAAAAMAANATDTSALVSALTKSGVAAANIQTTGLSVQPQYNSRGTVITGYQVVNSVGVTLYDVASTGRVIDRAAAAAGNAIQVNGINFSLRSETQLLGQARQAAVRQAAQQASIMASAAGSALGPICSLQDNSSQGQTVVEPEAFRSAAAAAPSTPVEAGSLQVTADVTAVYQLVAEH